MKLEDLVVGRAYNMELEGVAVFKGIDEKNIYLQFRDANRCYSRKSKGEFKGFIGFDFEPDKSNIDFLVLTEIEDEK